MHRNNTNYRYRFSNGESHVMTPIEAHKYAHKHKIDIWEGPGYIEQKKEKSFDGFGWHDGLRMSFKGPRHYREYLKEHGLHEASILDRPSEQRFKKPLWDADLIRKCNALGMEIGGVLAEALISGELDYPEDGMAKLDD